MGRRRSTAGMGRAHLCRGGNNIRTYLCGFVDLRHVMHYFAPDLLLTAGTNPRRILTPILEFLRPFRRLLFLNYARILYDITLLSFSNTITYGHPSSP